MIAHNYEKSKLGIFGFDTLNIYTDDEIYCSGFRPTAKQIDLIGCFCQGLRRKIEDNVPVHLYITKKSHLFWVDVKIADFRHPLFADSHALTIELALDSARKKLLQNYADHRFSYYNTSPLSNRSEFYEGPFL